jgi:hypothetical protein
MMAVTMMVATVMVVEPAAVTASHAGPAAVAARSHAATTAAPLRGEALARKRPGLNAHQRFARSGPR